MLKKPLNPKDYLVFNYDISEQDLLDHVKKCPDISKCSFHPLFGWDCDTLANKTERHRMVTEDMRAKALDIRKR